MKDLSNLTEEEEREVFRGLRPIGVRAGDKVHNAFIIDGEVVRITKKEGKDESDNEERV